MLGLTLRWRAPCGHVVSHKAQWWSYGKDSKFTITKWWQFEGRGALGLQFHLLSYPPLLSSASKETQQQEQNRPLFFEQEQRSCWEKREKDVTSELLQHHWQVQAKVDGEMGTIAQPQQDTKTYKAEHVSLRIGCHLVFWFLRFLVFLKGKPHCCNDREVSWYSFIVRDV